MYDFEYQNILDFWANEFDIQLSTRNRTGIIKLYESAQESKIIDADFNSVCKHVVLNVYCEAKYPHMNLFESVFSIHGMN